MKNKYKYLILLFLSLIVFFLTFVKTPQELIVSLSSVASETKQIALIMHCVFLIVFVVGLFVKKTRNILFSLLILILSGSATLLAFKYRIIPNIIVFGAIFTLSLVPLIKKEMSFDISNVGALGKIIAFLSLAIGFYYLHWIEEPVWINAFFYSPLGIINCPTLITICGLLIFSTRPGLAMLEVFTACITLYFGFFGIMRLGAKIDFMLIISGLYVIFRQVSRLENKSFYRET